MRWPALIFLLLLCALQYPLWFGQGSWRHVHQAQNDLAVLKAGNDKIAARNAEMAAEVKDLKTGYDAIEDKARFDLGLVKPGETFVQLPVSASAPRQSATKPR